MSTLSWIVMVSIAGGILSVVAAASLLRNLSSNHVTLFVSYSIGALLGAALMEILPHAFEHAKPAHITGTLLLGILVFFLLEKLLLWRHCHHDHCEAHDITPSHHDFGRSGMMIMIGDSFHNFVDGILIAAAFLESTQLGIITALAIIAHEIPQEVGDFLILLHSGYSRKKALLFNLLSSLATLIGGVLAYFALSEMTQWIPTLLAIAAASMIYVSVADLIPSLHKRTRLSDTLQQVVLISLGVASIMAMRMIVGET